MTSLFHVICNIMIWKFNIAFARLPLSAESKIVGISHSSIKKQQVNLHVKNSKTIYPVDIVQTKFEKLFDIHVFVIFMRSKGEENVMVNVTYVYTITGSYTRLIN